MNKQWIVFNMSEQQTTLFDNLTSGLTSENTSDFTPNLSFDGFVDNFHFIRPTWLFAIFALFLVIFLLKKIRYYQSPWQHFLPAHLSSALLENSQNTENQVATSQSRYWLKPFIMGCCIIIALAGPAWQKIPQPVYQLARGSVLLMDMSYSMYATDVKPNRLTRARYKATDLLSNINEGDVGLVAYAGDAFIISPLTQDIKNIELLLPSLSPDIMPVHGANALSALILADKTLKNAGHVSGDIYWFTDDIDNEDMSDIYAWSNDHNHRLFILGVGTKSGAPIKLSSGELLKDNKGAIVIPKLPENRLEAITQRSRGLYRTMTNNNSDIKALTKHLNVALDDKLTTDNRLNDKKTEQILQGDQYLEQGPWLLLIILPLLLSYFRRGTSILAVTLVMPLTLMATLASFSPTTYAAEPIAKQTGTDEITLPETTSAETDADQNKNSSNQFWQSLWKTPNQQAQQHYQKEDYQQAAKQFEDSQWQGSAHYKAGNYEQALQSFKESDSPQSLYNQGNALTKLQKVDEAIDAYKKALEKDPTLSDAKDNLATLEAIKKQEEESKKDSQEQSQDPSKDSEKKQDENQESQKGKDNKEQSQDQSQDEQQDSESQEEQQSSEQNKEQSEQDKEQKDEKTSQSQEAKDKEEEQKKQEEQAAQAKKSDNEQQGDEKSLAQQVSDNKAQETQQKHQQLLNKVTDDPYLLLRNKMRLEYQKRRQEGVSQGVTKKW
jgi:Ca-activated chloride channel family protein